MTTLEDRLTAALAARADQVDAADLRPDVVPEPTRGFPVVRTLAVAAAVTALIAVPYGITRLDTDAGPGPAVTPSPDPVPTGRGAEWPVVATGTVDLDGDGTAEMLRLRAEGDGAVELRVEVTLPDRTVFVLRETGTSSYRIEDPVDVDGAGGEEVLVTIGTSLVGFGLVDGTFSELAAPADPPLARRTDAEGRTVTWVVEGGRLFTLRSVAPVPADSTEKYAVQRWRWSVEDGALVPERVQDRCVDPAEPRTAISCTPTAPALFVQTYPSFWTEEDAGPGGAPMPVGFPVDGRAATAELVYAPGFGPADWISPGDVELVVTAGDTTYRIDVPPGPLPTLVEQPATLSASGEQGIVVLQQDVSSDVWVVFAWNGAGFEVLDQPRWPAMTDGEQPAPAPGVQPYLGSGYDGTGNPANFNNESWIQDGWLYTSTKVSRVGEDARDVYRWSRDGDALAPTLLGRYCFDQNDVGRDC